VSDGGNTGNLALADGLEVLRQKLPLKEVMRLIEQTARWVDPKTFELLPVWYPEHARGTLFYKSNWSAPQTNKNRQTGQIEHKREANRYANMALTRALGLRSDERTNWSCCHIWGVDDSSFQSSNVIVRDRGYYSCVANMVLLPAPLKAFTDADDDVKAMLRLCARNLYRWHCDHELASAARATVDGWTKWDAYPASWPRTPQSSPPPGIAKLNSAIERNAQNRLFRIRKDLKEAGPHYPRDEVRGVLARWNIPEEWNVDGSHKGLSGGREPDHPVARLSRIRGRYGACRRALRQRPDHPSTDGLDCNDGGEVAAPPGATGNRAPR
jgi:hypothetical protein